MWLAMLSLNLDKTIKFKAHEIPRGQVSLPTIFTVSTCFICSRFCPGPLPLMSVVLALECLPPDPQSTPKINRGPGIYLSQIERGN